MKAEQVTVDRIAYIRDVGNGEHAYFLAPVIDRLSITFPIKNKDEREGLVSILVGLVKEPESGFSNAKISGAGYKQHVELTDQKSGGTVLIEFQPHNPSNAFLRFEFRPSILNVAGAHFLKSKFDEFLMPWWTFEDVINKGKVTRVDVASDIVNCSVKSLIVQFSKPGKSHMYFGVDDTVESIYLGITPDKKNSHDYVYNKRQEHKDKGYSPKYGGAPWTRVEARLTTQSPFVKLKSKANPLANFMLYHVDSVDPPEAKHHWVYFTDSCRQRGVQNALALLPMNLAPKYKAALAKAQDGFWQPEKLWQHWPDALKRIGF